MIWMIYCCNWSSSNNETNNHYHFDHATIFDRHVFHILSARHEMLARLCSNSIDIRLGWFATSQFPQNRSILSWCECVDGYLHHAVSSEWIHPQRTAPTSYTRLTKFATQQQYWRAFVLKQWLLGFCFTLLNGITTETCYYWFCTVSKYDFRVSTLRWLVRRFHRGDTKKPYLLPYASYASTVYCTLYRGRF